jgi:GTP cyclohydrolase I
MPTAFDHDRAARAVRELLLAAGLDPESQQLAKTPRRVAEAYAEFFSGVRHDPAQLLRSAEPLGENTGELVLMRNISFRSICEHHLLPFRGQASIAYVPGEVVVGLSALPRLVHTLAARPQVQERLGEQVAETLWRELGARGVLVVMTARHGCVADRGVNERDAQVVTVASRGDLSDVVKRTEVMTFLGETGPSDAATAHEDSEGT